MKLMTIKFAAILSAIAIFVAHTSSMACFIWVAGEPKMPESLYIKD